jgi:hypothetical protein
MDDNGGRGRFGHVFFKALLSIEVSGTEYLDLRGRKLQEVGEDSIMRNFITYKLHQILLE